jgi:adenine-specific DNA-methyltransferase
MPTLNWIGKEKVINHHQDVPYKTLEPQYGFADGVQQPERNDSGNKIIHGDNLEALKSLLPEYEGKIKCIYIDPPYNTGNESWVYNDNVNHPKIKKWLGEVVGKDGEDLTRHDKWLCMMYPRLKLLHKLLANDGVIFISIDDNEQANLKLICDEIFGIRNFVTQFIWQKRKGGGNDSFYAATDHEYILVYVKNKFFQVDKWKVSYEEEYLKRYKHKDEIGLYYYDTLSRPGLNNPIIYDVICPDGSIIKNGTWQISKETFENELKTGSVDFIKNKKNGYTVVRKVRMPQDGRVFRSLITEVTNKNAADEMELILGEKKAFSTPKPVKLLEKLLALNSDKNSIILDSFAGSGTTAHAVLNLNNQDGGNRKYILIEMEDYADTITAERVKRVINGYGEDNKKIEGTGGSFNYYQLGEPLFLEDDVLNEAVGLENILKYIWYSETRTSFTNHTIGSSGSLSFGEGWGEDENYRIGSKDQTDYYFYYTKDAVTTVDYDFMAKIKHKASQYIIYADNCLLEKDFMLKHHIIFKKIPRDITRF